MSRVRRWERRGQRSAALAWALGDGYLREHERRREGRISPGAWAHRTSPDGDPLALLREAERRMEGRPWASN